MTNISACEYGQWLNNARTTRLYLVLYIYIYIYIYIWLNLRVGRVA